MLLQIDWSQLSDLAFWIESNPGALSARFEILFVMILIVCYGLFFVAWGLHKHLERERNEIYSDFWRRFARMFFVMGITFTFIFFFRSEGIPVLGGRYWFLLWAVGFVFWFTSFLYNYYVTLPRSKG